MKPSSNRFRGRSPLFPGLLLIGLGLMSGDRPAAGQEWAGSRLVHGTVRDTGGEPIVEAAVQIHQLAEPAAGPPPTRTGAAGEWSLSGLAPGRYEIHVKATGFINVTGWVTIPAAGAADPVEVEMLPLSWGTPLASAGNPHTLRVWIEKGNSLLEQGQPAEAREIYRRTLEHLPRAGRPEVLQGIARTYFLEGAVDEAAATLEQALEIAPDLAAQRRLYSLLLEGQGRGAEAAAFLAELDARPAPEPQDSAEADEVAGPTAPVLFRLPPQIEAILAAPAEPPTAHRTGAFKTAFAERAPLSRLDDYARRMGTSADEIRIGDPGAGAYELAQESFQVVVADRYEPRAGWGILVWISPTPFGGTRRPDMAEVLARHRLIWVGANRSGNGRPVWDRVMLALDAAHNMQRFYDLDSERIYVGGYSGGGRAASRMGVLYPEVVHGAWALYGCDYFRPLPVVERPGASWPAKYGSPPPEVLEIVRRRTRFVLVTGTRDFNFTQTRSTAREMRKDGFERLTYLEMPEADHYTFPDAAWLDRIFAALDGEPD